MQLEAFEVGDFLNISGYFKAHFHIKILLVKKHVAEKAVG